MTRFSPACGVTASSEQFSADLGDEIMILSLATEMYYGLSGVASRIWEVIREGATVGEVEDVLLEEFDVEPERCRRDLQRFLGELESRGIIAVSRAGGAE